MKKRLLSILLTLCLVIPLLPVLDNPLRVEAEETEDAFGIPMDDSSFDAEKEKNNNPYGTNDWVSMYTVSELFVAKGHSSNRYWQTYNYNEDGKPGSIGKATSNYVSRNEKGEGNKGGFQMVDSTPCDANGEGQKRYTATLGYWKDHYMQLFLTDSSGNRVSNTVQLGNSDTLDFLEEADAFEYTGMISVAAGNFTGSGRDSVIAYVPEMESDSTEPAAYMFDINSSRQLVNKRKVVNIYSILGCGNLSTKNSSNGKVFKNAPVVQLVSADTDKDNIDELVITAGLNDPEADAGERQAQMFIYDYVKNTDGSWSWQRSFTLNTKGYSGSGGKRLRWASSSVGDIILDNDVDFPEIITAGWIDKKDGDNQDVTSNIGSYVTSCTKVTKSEGGTPVGSYNASQLSAITTGNNGINNVSEFTEGGHYEDDHVQSLLPVAVFRADGYGEAASILISDTVYKLEDSTLKGQYRRDYFNDDDDGIGSSIISNGLVQDVTVGNFDGNEEGREQVIFCTCQKQNSINNYWYCIYTYKKNSSNNWDSYETGWEINKKGDAYMSLCSVDTDNDSTVVRIKSASMTFTEPEVLALLESTPYYGEVEGGDIGNSETAYGKSDGSGSSTSTSNGLTTQIITGFEYEVDDLTGGLTCGFELEATVENNFTWETTKTTTTEYSLDYSNDTGENMVVVYRRPVTVWEYEVKNSDRTMVMARQGTLLTSMISMDEYNDAAKQYGLSEVTENMLAEPGNPFSYRSSLTGLSNGVQSKNPVAYNGKGTISQSFTYSQEQEKSFTYELNTSFTACGKVMGVKAGGGAGYAHTESESTINTTSISKSGAVTCKDTEGYDFTWEFAHWTTKLNDTEIPVLGYLLTKVKAPPCPPTNLGIEKLTSTTAKITWDLGRRAADEYRLYQLYPDGTRVQIGVVDGTETSYTLTRLMPNTTYTYAMTAYAESGICVGESVLSEELTVTTLPEGLASVEIISPEDVSVRIGETATFKADISVNSDTYQATNYQWQKRVSGDNWEDISGVKGRTLTVENVQKEESGTQYRCIFKVSYANADALIKYYSTPATLLVGPASVNVSLDITGHDKTGLGTVAKPYVGKADYQKAGTPIATEVKKEQNVVIEAEGERPQLTVYKLGSAYYGIGIAENGENVYYTVEKTTSGYSAGSKIDVVEKVSYQDIGGTEVNDLPSDFNPDSSIVQSIGGSTCYLMAKVNGIAKTPIDTAGAYTAVDTRLASATGYTLYWLSGGKYYAYTENGGKGAEVSGLKASDLYEVYSVSTSEKEVEDASNPGTTTKVAVTTVLLGRQETWTQLDAVESTGETKVYEDVSRNYYTRLVKDSASCELTQMTMDKSEVYQNEDGDEITGFNPAQLEIVTEKVTETINTPVYTPQTGTVLTLTASVTEKGGAVAAKDALVDFHIINTQTNSLETVSAKAGTDGNATAQWSAPSNGLYSIKAVVRTANGYATNQTANQYYDAGITVNEAVTEYRLKLSKGGQDTAGAISYGETVSAILQQRTVTETSSTEWADYTGDDIVYTYQAKTGASSEKTLDATKSCQPESAGLYNFRAYKGSVKSDSWLAMASLDVKRVAVTISPSWPDGKIPGSAKDVTIVTDPTLPETLNLSEIFDVLCDYFNLSAAEKVTAGGRFSVALNYKSYAGNDALKEKILAFQNNYQVTFKENVFTKKVNSAKVLYESGENGSLIGQYSEYYYPMESGDNRNHGEKIRFMAIPNEGFEVAYWTVNGTRYETDEKLPDGMAFNKSGTQLNIESFDMVNHVDINGILDVSVEFESISNTVTYSVSKQEGSGNGTVSAVNETGAALKSGASVSNGSSVTFTAEPENGYIVEQWVVNDKIYHWDNTEEIYRGISLTLENIQEAKNVVVYFKKQAGTYNVSVTVVNEDGETDASLATVTAANAETGEEIALPAKAREGLSLTFNAAVANKANHMVKEWQISTDGGQNFAAVKGSGGQTSFTLYNVKEDTIVRPIITTAQTYQLQYKVMMNGEEVTNTSVAKLTAESNGQKLSKGEVSAYIPVDFALLLNSNYYLVDWSDNVEVDAQDNSKATLASITDNTEVVVTIAEKPIVSWTEPANGTITATCPDAEDAEKTLTLKNGAHVAVGTDVTVTFTPDTGYVFEKATVNSKTAATEYADASGETTDARTVVLNSVDGNRKIAASFRTLDKYAVTYDIVKAVENKPYGTLTAKADRKNLDAYKADSISSGDKVYEGSDVTFTAEPDEGYRVKEWIVNGEVQKASGMTITTNTLTLSDVKEAKNVTVQFVKRGSNMTIQAGENGRIVSAIAGNMDQINNISDGFILGANASVKITAKADTGYEIEKWAVNNETVMDGEEPLTDEVYTYQADENASGVEVKVFFRQITYPVSWSAAGGTVSAEGYDGKSADIRGGTTVKFTAVPDAGNTFDYWSVNGQKVEDVTEDTLEFVVPAGAAQTPAVSSYQVMAVFKKAPYTVTYTQPEEHGTLTAKAGKTAISSGDLVDGNTVVTFTAAPDKGYMVGSWTVNNEVIDSQASTYAVTVQEDTDVSVTLIPDAYTVKASVKGNGKLTVGDVEADSYQAAYGKSLTFTAKPDNYWVIHEWKVDGQTATEGVSDDKQTFTLSDIREEHEVEAVFAIAALYNVSYSVDNPDGGSLKAVADNQELTLKPAEETSVNGGSRLEFTALPEENMMVDSWMVNGQPIDGNNSNNLVIESLEKNVNVVVSYKPYKGYLIPEGQTGYTITDVERTPADTTPETEIRENGTLTFTVSPDSENGYNAIGTLQINGYDCVRNVLADENLPLSGCEKVTAKANKDGSYTVTIVDVTADISVDIRAHKLQQVNAKAPTCVTEGNIKHWVCVDENCQDAVKKFADDKAVTPLAEGKEVIPVDKVNGHAFTKSKAVFTWKNTKTVTATLTCPRCHKEKVLKCTVTAKEKGWYIYYTATAKNEGLTYTNVKKAAIPKPWVNSELRTRLSTSGKNITVKWSKVPGADGYVIYGSKCGTPNSKVKAIKVIKKGSTTSWIDKNKKPGACYKYYVKAYKLIDGKRAYIKKSAWVHAVVRGGKYTNIKKLKTVSALTLKKGTKKMLTIKKYYEDPKKTAIKHMTALRFTTTNKKVATVTSSGIVKAKGKGSCYIYVTAYSGAYTKVRVTVK